MGQVLLSSEDALLLSGRLRETTISIRQTTYTCLTAPHLGFAAALKTVLDGSLLQMRAASHPS